MISWVEDPIDIPLPINSWMTVWRSGDDDIRRGDIHVSPEGKAVLIAGRNPTEREQKIQQEKLDDDQTAPAVGSKVPVQFSYRYVVATRSGAHAKLGIQILPVSLDKIDAIIWKDTQGVAGVFHWIDKAVAWHPKMHPRYRFQGPAAFLAPSNPDELADVGTLSSPFYRGEVREAILVAKTPLELTGERERRCTWMEI